MGEASARDDFSKSPIIKRSIAVRRHRTSICLEEPFWNSFCKIAREKNISLSKLVEQIDSERTQTNLSSAVRLFVLAQFRAP